MAHGWKPMDAYRYHAYFHLIQKVSCHASWKLPSKWKLQTKGRMAQYSLDAGK